VTCRVLNVSRPGYYGWLGRPASLRDQENEYSLKQTTRIHADSGETYGSPRVHAELTLGLGLSVNLQRVARLMRAVGIQGLYRRRRHGCTLRDPAAAPSSDLVQRQFTVDEPNRLWVTDITEHPTGEDTADPTPEVSVLPAGFGAEHGGIVRHDDATHRTIVRGCATITQSFRSPLGEDDVTAASSKRVGAPMVISETARRNHDELFPGPASWCSSPP